MLAPHAARGLALWFDSTIAACAAKSSAGTSNRKQDRGPETRRETNRRENSIETNLNMFYSSLLTLK
jgi:hypothetical protein